MKEAETKTQAQENGVANAELTLEERPISKQLSDFNLSLFDQLVKHVPDEIRDRFFKFFTKKSQAMIPILIFFKLAKEYGGVYASEGQVLREKDLPIKIARGKSGEAKVLSLTLCDRRERIILKFPDEADEEMNFFWSNKFTLNVYSREDIRPQDYLFAIVGAPIGDARFDMGKQYDLHTSPKMAWVRQVVCETLFAFHRLSDTKNYHVRRPINDDGPSVNHDTHK
jgi:hypothetical protein